MSNPIIRRHGTAFVVSGPSGTGKTTLCREFLDGGLDIRFSVSCTTRPPRPTEVDGRDYYFVAEDEFLRRVAAGDFIEHARVHKNLYGTLKTEVTDYVLKGQDVFLDIDIQGALQIREVIADQPWAQHTRFIFIGPPSVAELEQRLRGRGTESEEVVRGRMEVARHEMAQWRKYDYLVINDTLEQARHDLAAIFRAEHQRTTTIATDSPWDDL
jgi:guanylate kinase